MLEKYRTAIDAIPAGCRKALMESLGVPAYVGHIYDVLEAAGLNQADVVLALMRLETPESLWSAEAILGKPIARCPPGLRDACPEKSLWAQAQWVLSMLGVDGESELDARRVLWAAPNPRLPSTPSFQRFRLIKIGSTVGAFLRRGGTRRDIREWTREGSVVLGN